MIKTLNTFAMAVLITGATVIAAQAQTAPYAVDNVSITLVVPKGATTSTTNSKTGTITDTYSSSSVTTAKVISDLGTALGVTFKPSATLVAVTELAPGVNLTDESNVVTQTYTYTNAGTNTPITVTNTPPLTNFDGLTNWVVTATNAPTTNGVYETTNSIIVGTNTSYYVSSGGTLTLIPTELFFTSRSEASTPLTNINLANGLTNLFFKGTIKTNLDVTGSLLISSGGFEMNANGAANAAAGAGGPIISSFSGIGPATAATGTVGKGKTAMPYSSFNYTWNGDGTGTIGGTAYPTSTNTTYVYGVSNAIVGTNYFTNYSISNGTSVRLTGTVKHTFSKIVQAQ